MAGRITVSTLNDDTGVLATQNGMTGIPKAWVRASVSGISPTIENSFNVSSLTYNSTGDYTVNFTTAMPNANYSFSGCAGQTISNVGTWLSPYTSPTTTAFRFETSTWSTTRVLINVNIIGLAFFSS